MKLVQYWQGPKDDNVEDFSRAWREAYPDLGYKIFDFASAKAFLRGTKIKGVAEAFEKCKLPAMQSDVFRLAYVYVCGGLYIDCGTRLIKPIARELWPVENELLLLRMDTGRVWNGFLFAQSEHEALREIVETVIANILGRHDRFGNPSNNVLAVSGPVNFQHLRLPPNRKKFNVTLLEEEEYQNAHKLCGVHPRN